MEVVIWSRDNCPHCVQAVTILAQKNIKYEERKIGNGWTKESLLTAIPGAKSVPQIVINNTVIGGYTQLVNFLKNTHNTSTENTHDI